MNMREGRRIGGIVGMVATACLVALGCPGQSARPDPCEGVTCSFHGACITDGVSPYCSCLEGYHPVGLACVENDPVDPCAGVDCSAHGTCLVVSTLPVCDCEDGWRLDESGLLCFPAGPDADAGADADGGTTCSGGYFDPDIRLCWQDPPADAFMTWDPAGSYCDDLELGGHGPGSWHLPTISELRSLVRGCPATEFRGDCGVTDECLPSDYCRSAACDGCDELRGPGVGGAYWPAGLGGGISWYWSSSDQRGYKWAVSFYSGRVGWWGGADYGYYVRCVRRVP